MHRKEKRSAKRIAYLCEVECEGSGTNRLNTRINDLSATGAFIDSMTCFPVGSILKLRFRVKERLIEATAQVRYAMEAVGMGVHFVDLKPEHRALLEGLVDGKPLSALEQSPIAVSNILSGNFAVVNLFDIIHMIENGRLSGTLKVKMSDLTGEVYFNDGQIVGAKAEAISGIEALNRFLGATEGAFEFKKTAATYERTIEATSNTALLLDLLRTQDEEATLP